MPPRISDDVRLTSLFKVKRSTCRGEGILWRPPAELVTNSTSTAAIKCLPLVPRNGMTRLSLLHK